MKQGEVRVWKQNRMSSVFWRNIQAETGGHLASVLLQVLLESGPRMTPSALCLGGGSVENVQVSRVCS